MVNKKKILILIVSIFFLGILVFILIYSRSGNNRSLNNNLEANNTTAVINNNASDNVYDSVDASSANNNTAESLVTATTTKSVPFVNPIQVAGPSLSALPGSPEAPKQEVITKDKEVSAKAIKLGVSANGFDPREFTINAGEEVILAISATDDKAHLFLFPNATLMALTTMVFGKQTKTITFNAPAAGIYEFNDGISAYSGNTGKMIVK